MKVPFNDLRRIHDPLRTEFGAAFERVINNSSYILGREVEDFEQRFAEYCGARYAVGVSSGTDALELILRGYNIGKGDEVITVPNSFIATASAVAFTGAKPVFVDCGEDYNIDAGRIEERITERTRAVIPVHLYGQPADMDEVIEIARRHNLKVVEDACQAHGAMYRGKKAGNLGGAAAFSFYPGKNLGAFGDGGIVVSDDADLIARIRMMRNYGQSEKYHHATKGYNRRLDALQAAILGIKLPHLDKWNRMRATIAEKYSDMLKEVVEVPAKKNDRESIWHLYVIAADNRDELQKHLRAHEIETGLHYPIPIHLQQSFSMLGHKPGDFPNTEKSAKRILSLPIFPVMNEGEADYVCEKIREFYL